MPLNLLSLCRWVARQILRLRYRIEVKGIDLLNSTTFPKKKLLFLPNHPSALDPAILITLIPMKFAVRPLVMGELFEIFGLRWFLKKLRALPIPNFDMGGNQYTRRQAEKVLASAAQALKQEENLLVYPSGRLTRSGKEEVGASSAAQFLVEQEPEVQVVLIRTTGLYGSSFSTGLTGKSPPLVSTLWEGFKIAMANAIFFTPRRKVLVEFERVSQELPKTNKLQFNRFLEEWYNRPFSDGKETLSLIPYYFWSSELPKVAQESKKKFYSSSKVSQEIRQTVLTEVARVAKRPLEEIHDDQQLSQDLALDSLDVIELITFLDVNYEVGEVRPEDLNTVGSLLALASDSLNIKRIEEEDIQRKEWREKERPPLLFPKELTIPHAFLTACDQMKSATACADDSSGILSYRRLKMAVLVLSQQLRKRPEEKIGILLPASVASSILILACYFAKKIPVMLNWTLGSTHLKEAVKMADIGVIISSSRFLNRAKNMDLEGVDDKLLFLEEIKQKISLKEKLQAWISSFAKSPTLIRRLQLETLIETDTAVILFTSGTENLPKGVPLSHKNILSNQRSALQCVKFYNYDVMIGFLPPFHSFGFSVTGLLPLLTGCRVAYFPDPTDGGRLARCTFKWGGSLICSAPTFLKAMLRFSREKQLNSVRLFISGAEKAPESLFEQIHQINSEAELIEGYGITECAPILTLNRPERPRKGVGQPLPDVEIIIVDLETYKKLDVNQEGLILVRGPNVFNGYLKDSPSPFVEVERRVWYKTGDLGSLDENHYLTLSGRIKRFVKIGGEMVNLRAIEEYLIQFTSTTGNDFQLETPSLALCAVQQGEERPRLVLFSTLPLSVKEANEILRKSGLSNLNRINEVEQVKEIPLLGTGKINYRLLEQQLLN